MMDTDALIQSLSESVTPVTRRSALGNMAAYLIVGGLAALVVLALTIGIRPDLDVAMLGGLFWMKLSYTGSLALIATLGLITLTRPEAGPPRGLWLAVAPLAALAVISIVEAAAMDHDAWMHLWLGTSWRTCPFLIAVLALPIAAAIIRALRPFAPTQLRMTGAVAGLVAGAFSATIYCLHCPEVGAAFVLTWYTLGIALVAVAGALIGPRLLRW
jgi:hypothetical protein